MAPPERFTETQIEEILQQLARKNSLVDGVAYAKSDLLAALEGPIPENAEYVFAKFRTLAQTSGRIGTIEVSVEGTRKWRTYTFNSLSVLVARRDPTAAPATPANDESTTASPKANDHPEDRVHLHAHVALLLARRCVGISLPKTSGARGRGNTLHENPDYVGIRAEREAFAAVLPDWLDFGAAQARHLLIGAEIKSNINTSGELSRAVRQALHNGRYFHERWLVAPVAQSLYAEATVIGEEYNVGIIALAISPSVRHHVLWNPRPSSSRATFRDFVSRYDAEELAALCEKLDTCRSVAEKLSDALRSDLLRQLLSDQRNESLLRRLPVSISESLEGDVKQEIHKQDVLSLGSIVHTVLMDAYEYDAAEEQGAADFVAANLGKFLKSTGVPVSVAARQLILAQMKTEQDSAAKEAREFADAVCALKPA